MKKRKLQIFISSTYEDLIDQRLAAMEAILAAGHIPAAMEQFSPGDETAWDKIRRWIDESDAFILIFGGRYGSIEPGSGKSYVQLEYEYALERKKPFFSLVIREKHHEERVKEFGLGVDERTHRREYADFKTKITARLCGYWNDKKDIKVAIFQKLPEWAQKEDLVGWIRGDEILSNEVTNELARLSQENRELRSQSTTQMDKFDGLSFEDLVRFLRERPIRANQFKYLLGFVPEGITPKNAGELFEYIQEKVSASSLYVSRREHPDFDLFDGFLSFGLIERSFTGDHRVFSVTDLGRLFRNRLLLMGSLDDRIRTLWKPLQEGN